MTEPSTKPSRLCYRAVEFRAEQHSDGRTLEGYAAVFDSPSRIDSWEGVFDESIARGAFKRTLNARKPVLQFDHGRDTRTGSVPIGSLDSVREDEHGLFVSARMFDNDLVEPIRQAIEGGAIDGMSFRFRVVREDWRDKNGKAVRDSELLDLLWHPGDRGPLQRSIREVELFELGPVVFPAYESTTVGVRSMLNNLSNDERDALVRDLAHELRQSTDEPDPEVTSSEPAATSETDVPAEADRSASEKQEPAKPGTSVNETSERENTTMDVMSVAERAERQSEIRARLAEIDTEYNGAALPDEARSEWDSLDSEYQEHERAIADDNRRKERIRQLADAPGGTEKVDNARAGYGRGPAVHVRQENIYDLAELRNKARSIDELPQLYRDNAMRAVESSRFPSVKREAAQDTVSRLLDSVDDDQGTLARRVLVTGSPMYDRAFGKAMATMSTNGLNSEEQRALSLGTDTAGGFAVPFQLDPTVILTSDGYVDPLRQISRVEQIVGKTWQGITSAGITVSRAAESQEATDDSPSFAQPEVTPTRVQGFVPFSMEIDQDWTRMRAEITAMLSDAKAEEEANSFVLGDGAGNNPSGVVSTLATSSHVDAAGEGIAVGDLYAVEEALPPRFRGRAQWLANRSIYNRVRQLDTAGGANLWVRLAAGSPSELIGYPTHEASAMDGTIDAAATDTNLVLLFGDFSKFLIVDRIGMSVELIPHLFGSASRFPTGQRGIYAVWRNSSKVLADNAFRLLKVTTSAT